MRTRNKRRSTFIVLLLILAMVFAGCQAKSSNSAEDGKKSDAYPEKPVTVIVGFSAGGGTDTAARLLFQYAEKYLGQSFAIVNKTGASGEIAWTELAMSDPDGYTIGFINPPTFLSHPIQRHDCKYKLDDFSIIANLVADPAVIAVSADSEIDDLKEYFETALSRNFTVGYSGPGTSESLMLRQLEELTNTSLDKIPFDGSAPSVVALLGGHVESVCMNVSEAINYVQDGSLKIIGVASNQRSADFPDVPTFQEQEFDVLNIALRGVAAPAGMDPSYLEKIEQAIYKATQDPEFLAKAKEISLPVSYMDSTEYTDLLNKMHTTLKEEFSKGEW